ncbi:MAG: heme exporter protein CcmB [Gammaproteobacteria bacterium]|nr:heme exporter protein CcmB [Gammaproteobacteria bacterium]MDE0282194.1 heme exporter protein CcmB [Gammaproteobacteria bacterium]MDE0715219.1 heme exporter protein CcmB [Gammaproteobacteria bacterium]MXX16617.1 heme exporter protein CcmB [Gammaproteobacteria bacterium]MXY64328.1 heme exporter protein CcmB [Gammaproteobacteria bacterium]
MTDHDQASSAQSLWSGFLSLLRRDLRIALRERNDLVQPVLFFVVVVSLFPLSVAPDRQLLQDAGPGIIWVSALLATLLALDSMFRPDYEDGSLEQLALSPQPLSLLVLAKAAAHWLASAVPLIVVSPLLAMLMQLPGNATGVLALSLVLGTPALSLIGAVGVGLTVGIRRNGVLLSLLVLPLYVPALIFGAGAVQSVMISQDPTPHLLLLAAFSLFTLAVCPLAAAAAIRISLN